jgi:hypothetical protein
LREGELGGVFQVSRALKDRAKKKEVGREAAPSHESPKGRAPQEKRRNSGAQQRARHCLAKTLKSAEQCSILALSPEVVPLPAGAKQFSDFRLSMLRKTHVKPDDS